MNSTKECYAPSCLKTHGEPNQADRIEVTQSYSPLGVLILELMQYRSNTVFLIHTGLVLGRVLDYV